MPIGKDSITKRVAKQTPEKDIVTETLTPPQAADEKTAPELVATIGVAPTKNAPAKKSSVAKANTAKTGEAKSNAAKATASKKPATPKKTASKPVETSVLANVSPETVAAVIGHKEDAKYEKVQIGQKMPDFLL